MSGPTKWAADSRQPPQGRKIGRGCEGGPCRGVKGGGEDKPAALRIQKRPRRPTKKVVPGLYEVKVAFGNWK